MNDFVELRVGNDVQVYSANLLRCENRFEEFRASLSADELDRAFRYRTATLTRKFILRRGLLRELLACQLNQDPVQITFHLGEFGKPMVEGDVHFNASSSQDEVIFAFSSTREVGIDIEQIKNFQYEGLLNHHFTTLEVDQILKAPLDQRTEAFFRAWARKEARLKAIGVGIASQAPLIGSALTVVDLNGPDGYAAAVAF